VNGVDVAFDDNPGHGRLRRRRVILLAVAGLAIAAAIGGLLVSATIKSPAQQAAETRSPGLTRLTAPVQHTVITNTIQANGVVAKPARVSSLSGGGGGGGPGNAQQVVTRIFRPAGSTVEPGNAIIEVAGRPLFVLPGTVPAYRDMLTGETGSDIAQLQAGLQELGFSTGGDESGVYGAGTAAAVEAFYHDLGYSAPMVPVGTKAPAGGKAHKQQEAAEVPLSEIMFVPHFPARVVSLGGKVGAVVSGPLVTLSMGNPGIKGQLNPAFAAQVRPGMRVRITAQGSSATVRGTITSVGTATQTAKSISGGIYLPMHIQPDRPLPPAMGPGQDVILSIKAGKTSGAMLAVPEAAVFGGQDGRDYVSKVTGPNTVARVAVQVITQGDGLVGIKPLTSGALATGDMVVTGQNYQTNPLGKPGVRPGRFGPSGAPGGSIKIVTPG
jgi:peptidoglycan hydrolase-like protein with peptidoglycan-binding domain